MTEVHKQLDEGTLLAFCHIEKAAGTSLTHILRRVFFLRYAAVRPMHSHDHYYFTARDLRTILRIHPFLKGIGGHSVVPHTDLTDGVRRLAFITQVREPIARAVSHYRFWTNRMMLNTSREDFLRHPTSRNFQVKKIAGTEDIDRAKDMISKHFLLAGTTDRFDEFITILARKLGMPLSMFLYRNKNVDRTPDRTNRSQEFEDKLKERNLLDQQLYEWVDNELFPKHIAEYPGNFSDDLAYFRTLQDHARESAIMPKVDFIYRNGYLKPISGLIRLSKGLPYNGSYSTE